MKLITFKKKYSCFHFNKIKFLNLFTFNVKSLNTELQSLTKKNHLTHMYILNIYINKIKILKYKKIIGFLIKNSYKLNSTKIHLLQIKKYNNIYFSFYKEAPNIFIY